MRGEVRRGGGRWGGGVEVGRGKEKKGEGKVVCGHSDFKEIIP